jgi:hypothetical protein
LFHAESRHLVERAGAPRRVGHQVTLSGNGHEQIAPELEEERPPFDAQPEPEARCLPGTLGFAAEFAKDGIAANTLWPRTTIATAAVQNLLGGDMVMAASRTPAIYADAAYEVLIRPAREYTGQTLIVEDVLTAAGVTDFSGYAAVPGTPDERMYPDIFLD